MTTRASRAALAFLLAATLATTALPAVSLFEGGASSGRVPVLEPLNFLDRLLAGVNRWQEKNGCQMDPNGRCLPKRGPAVKPVPRKNGCSVDPNGRCIQ